jgi:hypothetical protein
MLAAGGDFADGVITYEGRRLGGAVLASFDRRAVGCGKRRRDALAAYHRMTTLERLS